MQDASPTGHGGGGDTAPGSVPTATFVVTATALLTVQLEVEAENERAACARVEEMAPEELVAGGPEGLQGARSVSLGDVSVRRADEVENDDDE